MCEVLTRIYFHASTLNDCLEGKYLAATLKKLAASVCQTTKCEPAKVVRWRGGQTLSLVTACRTSLNHRPCNTRGVRQSKGCWPCSGPRVRAASQALEQERMAIDL